MKICVYGLVDNKQDLCTSWYKSIQHADKIIVGDLGSTDSTKQILTSLGVEVYDLRIEPFRYDIARNSLLSLIPNDIDIAISYDINQMISENWKTILSENWIPGTDRFMCVHQAQDKSITQSLNMIHSAKGYSWENPIFCTLKDKISEQVVISQGITISDIDSMIHINSTALLELALEKSPNNTLLQWENACEFLKKHPQLKNTFDLCRDATSIAGIEKSNDAFKYLVGNTAVDKAIGLFKEIAFHSDSELYRCESMIQLAYMIPSETYFWLTKASAEAPWYWKPHFELAKYFYRNRDWNFHLAMSLKTLNLIQLQTNNPILGYVHDYICIAAWQNNLREMSLKHAKIAAELLPLDTRIQNNLKVIEQFFTIELQ